MINALRNLLGQSCAVAAPTGKAAYNVQGVTLHSLLKLPVGPRGHKDLKGQSLKQLQQQFEKIQCIVIDEFSMLGQAMFGWVDNRLRQATAKTDELLGGISVILTGDLAQLPPVGDKSLYHTSPTSQIGQQGQFVYHLFNKVVLLTENNRVTGNDVNQTRFLELQHCLRTGDSTEDDWKLLMTRQQSAVDNLKDFDDSIRLFFNNDSVAAYNNSKLESLNQPVACINARHSTTYAKQLNSDDMSGLEPQIFLAKGAYVMLTSNLWPSVGLVNGACGEIIHIIYSSDSSPPDLPIAVIVKFEDYMGPSISSACSAVPIIPITASLDLNAVVHERQQVPLRLSWAMTIHKSQGLTLEKAWIELGKTEKISGLSYVALSRVRNSAV